MKNTELIRAIYQSLENGGATFTQDLQVINDNEGYCVSIQDMTIIELENDNIITELKNTIETIIATSKNLIGFWINENKLYIDIVNIYNNIDEALQVAKQSNQLAIFNLETKEEIFL